MLGRVAYGCAHQAPLGPRAVPDLQLPLGVIGDQVWEERWYSATPVQTVRHGALRCRHNGHVLWGCFALPLPVGQVCAEDVHARYLELFALLQQTGFGHLWRIWNFIPHINAVNASGLETYRDFNLGRARAFADAFDQGMAPMPWATRHMPAATGIGCRGETLMVYFLAGRFPGQHVENPRQVAAYHYPAEHGPRPPCFARASLVRLPAQRAFFISGTASIVGHRTVHTDDLLGQCQTTLENFALVAAQAGSSVQALRQCKIYVRHARDLVAVQAFFRKHLPASTQVGYFLADICRDNLLVEMEALSLQ